MDTLIRLGLSLLSTVLCFLPLEIWLVLNNWIQPTGFWQKALLIGAGLWIGGAIQFVLVIVWIAALFFIWTEL